MLDTRLACSIGVNKIPLRRSKTRQWKAWAEKIVVEEVEVFHGWRLPSRSFLKEVVGHVVTKAQSAFAMSMVVNRVWTQQRLSDMAMV